MGRRAQAWFREFDGYWYGVVVKGTPPRKLLKASNTKANQRKADDIFRSRTEATNPDATLDACAGGGLNGSYVLNASTVIDDGEVDTLWGDAGLDWFLTDALDEVHSASNETVTTS
jgi:hypothetical protein